MKEVGIPNEPLAVIHASEIVFLVGSSTATLYVMSLPHFCMKAGTASTFGSCPNNPSTLTPTTVSVSGCFLCSALKCGIALMHGGHQVAQNSTTYTWPGSNLVTGVPWIQEIGA